MDKIQEKIIKFLKKETELEQIDLEIPPKIEMGDYAFPCFALSKKFKKSPNEIATELATKFKLTDDITEVKSIGPYVNFYLNKSKLTEIVLDILKEKDKFGASGNGKGKKMLVEHTSINPNASPHVGRSRNALIGDSIVRILRFEGYKVEVHYFVNDIGKQIAMLVLGAKDRKKVTFSDLLDIYVEINEKLKSNPDIEKQAFDLLNKLENGDKAVRKQFRDIVDICVRGQEKIFSELDIKYDSFDYESDYLFSKKTDDALKKLEKTGKLFVDGHDRWVLDQKGYGLGMRVPVFVLTRADKTSLYGLRDIAYNFDKLKKGENINVIGEDQKLYQEQITAVFKELEMKAPRFVHYSFVLLKDGKMSTRKGNVVLLEDFMAEALEKAKAEMKKRHDDVNENAAKKVAYGAVKFAILKVSSEKNVIFDLDAALSFEGETGPYLQYTYARIKSILRKDKLNMKADLSKLTEKEELELIKAMSQFSEVVSKTSKELKPHLVCNYLYSLAQKLNEYYHAHTILKADKEIKDARLLLIASVSQVIKNGLQLLGIGVLEKM